MGALVVANVDLILFYFFGLLIVVIILLFFLFFFFFGEVVKEKRPMFLHIDMLQKVTMMYFFASNMLCNDGIPKFLPSLIRHGMFQMPIQCPHRIILPTSIARMLRSLLLYLGIVIFIITHIQKQSLCGGHADADSRWQGRFLKRVRYGVAR